MAEQGKCSVINCECYCKPVKDGDHWYGYDFIYTAQSGTCAFYCTNPKLKDSGYNEPLKFYHREKDNTGTEIGHRSCFYGLASLLSMNGGSLSITTLCRDFYVQNCNSLYRISGEENPIANVYEWINNANTSNGPVYSAIELRNIKYIFNISDNDTRITYTNSIKDDSTLTNFYNPLLNNRISVFKIDEWGLDNDSDTNRTPFYCNKSEINNAIKNAIENSSDNHSIYVYKRIDYNNMLKLRSAFLLPPTTS